MNFQRKEWLKFLDISVEELDEIEGGKMPQELSAKVISKICKFFFIDLTELFEISLGE